MDRLVISMERYVRMNFIQKLPRLRNLDAMTEVKNVIEKSNSATL
jgi:hypothetical protein